MRSVRAALDEGVRFAVVDRLPLDELSDDEGRALHWLLSSHIARPVAQKLDGTMIYDVHDTGQQALDARCGVSHQRTFQTLPDISCGLTLLRKATWAGMSRSEPNDLTVKVSPSRWRCTRSLKSG